MTSQLIPLNEASIIINKSTQTLRRLIKNNKIKFRRKRTPQGFNYYIDKRSLSEYFKLTLPPEQKEPQSQQKIKSEINDPSLPYINYLKPDAPVDIRPDEEEDNWEEDQNIDTDKKDYTYKNQPLIAINKVSVFSAPEYLSINREENLQKQAPIKINPDPEPVIITELKDIPSSFSANNQKQANIQFQQTAEKNREEIRNEAQINNPANNNVNNIIPEIPATAAYNIPNQNVVFDDDLGNNQIGQNKNDFAGINQQNGVLSNQSEIKNDNKQNSENKIGANGKDDLGKVTNQMKIITDLQATIQQLINQNTEDKRNLYNLLTIFQGRINLLEEEKKKLASPKENLIRRKWFEFWK